MNLWAVLALCVVSAIVGALGWERYQLRAANTEWAQTVEKVRKTNAEALAAERRLAASRTVQDAKTAKLEAAIDANADDCSVSDDEQRLLMDAAETTRTHGADIPAG